MVRYPQNTARHCFASHHIAYNRDATQTAFLLGHPSPALLYSTYRQLVSFEDAEKYWNLLPKSAAHITQEREDAEFIKKLEMHWAEKGKRGKKHIWTRGTVGPLETNKNVMHTVTQRAGSHSKTAGFQREPADGFEPTTC